MSCELPQFHDFSSIYVSMSTYWTIRINKFPANHGKPQFRWPTSNWSRKDTCFLLNYPAYAAALEVLTELTSLFCTSVKDFLWATEF